MNLSFWISTGMLVWIAINAVLIVMQRRPAASTIAWLLVLVFVPFVGLLIYRLLGPLSLERPRRERSRAKHIVDEGLHGLTSLDGNVTNHQLAQVSLGLAGSPPYRAAAADVYLDGASAYDALLSAVAAARDHVHVEYYIWEPDTIGTQLRDALIERARAGVTVRMIVDAAGSNRLAKKFLRPLKEAGVAFAWFNPIQLRTIRRRRADFRTHRKIVIVDGTIGFTGGMNISDLHSAKLSDDYWRDTHLRLVGPAVWPLQRVFFEDWHFVAGELLPVTLATAPAPECEGEHLVQVIASGPDSNDFAIHKVYFTAITQAVRRVWITTPYLVPDDMLLTAMVTASLRGVDVRLLVPHRSDSRLVDLAARSYYPELLAGKVRVFEYQPRFIHAKTLVVDDDISLVGTANLDVRSFRLNFEVAALMFGEPANRTLATAYEMDLEDSREVTSEQCASYPFVQRLGQAFARLFSPLL
jgi:cardiolipin synthase